MRLIDTHSHMYEPEFDADREEALLRAFEAGVEWLLCPAIDAESYDAMLEMCSRNGRCVPMMGLHPTSVKADPTADMYDLESRLSSPPPSGYCAIGEIGLDFYWSREFERQQIEVFRTQLDMALRLDLPVAIHVRDAWGTVTQILEEYSGRGLRGVMHAFSSNAENARRIMRCGDFMFGIGGVVTFRNSNLPQTLPEIGSDRLVLETDCPYLTPVPFRGRRNESSYVRLVCDKVAEIFGVSSESMAEKTSCNACRMFSLERFLV